MFIDVAHTTKNTKKNIFPRLRLISLLERVKLLLALVFLHQTFCMLPLLRQQHQASVVLAYTFVPQRFHCKRLLSVPRLTEKALTFSKLEDLPSRVCANQSSRPNYIQQLQSRLLLPYLKKYKTISIQAFTTLAYTTQPFTCASLFYHSQPPIYSWTNNNRYNSNHLRFQQMSSTSLSESPNNNNNNNNKNDKNYNSEVLIEQDSSHCDSPPPLIDVDCNLMHSMLHEFVQKYHPNVDSNTKDSNSNGDSRKENNNLQTETPQQSSTLDYYSLVYDLLLHDALEDCNICAMLTPSSTIQESRNSIEFVQKHRQQQYKQDNHMPLHLQKLCLLTTVGVHPYHVLDVDLIGSGTTIDGIMQELKDMIANSNNNTMPVVAAVGECGLDASPGFPPLEDQIPWFKHQVQLARSLQLPLFVHERLAFEETMSILANNDDNADDPPILIHCFTGNRSECKQYVERGYYISLSGYIFKDDSEAQETRLCLQEGLIPLDRLMIETDAPYMGFVGSRDAYLQKHSEYFSTSLNSKQRKRLTQSYAPNLPSALPKVLDCVLHHINKGQRDRNERPTTRNELALQTTRNANQFFKFGLEI